MFRLRLRPRLDYRVETDSEALTERLVAAAADYEVHRARDYLAIKIAEPERHYWSPQMQITLQREGDETSVNVLFTPMPAVWTLFVLCYSAIVVFGFFGAIYGFAKKSLGQPSPLVWSLPVSLALIACVYLAAQFGQHRGHAQTEELQALLESCLDASSGFAGADGS